MATPQQIREILGLEEGQTLASAVEHAVATAFKEKLSIGEGETVDLPKLAIQVEHLAAVNTEATLREISPAVVGRGGTKHLGSAIIEGAMSTWTMMKVGGQKIAIGAGHCALPYNLLDTNGKPDPNTEFVVIPPELSGLVISICLLPGYMEKRGGDDDIALLLLNDFPEGVDPTQVAAYPDDDAIARDLLRGTETNVGGTSLVGNVVGKCIATPGSLFIFVEDFGEVGMSGTLMYDTSPVPGNEPKILGVYLGTHKRGRDMKFRGRIRRLPPRDSFVPHSTFAWPQEAENIRLKDDRGKCHTFVQSRQRGSNYCYEQKRHGTRRSLWGFFVEKEPSTVDWLRSWA